MLLESQSGFAAMSEGVSLAVVGMVIVFAVLIVLALVFMVIQKYMVSQQAAASNATCCSHKTATSSNVPADVNVAISAALYLYLNEQNTSSSGANTIVTVDRRNSPWSSKIYGLNNLNFPR